jgi:hypothetical protein
MPITLTTAPKPGFWIAMADLTGAKTAQETQLSPAPTAVEYPNTARGEFVDTADGRVVVQVSNRDPRRHSWTWMNFGPEITTYERQYQWLQQLASRTRLSLGLSPYVYIYDSATRLLNVNRSMTITPSGVSGTTITVPSMSSTVFPANLKNGVVEVLSAAGGSSFPFERRSILNATSTTISITDALSGSLGASQILVTWSEPAWWKVRIVDTTRELRGEGGSVRYSASKLTFVIDEETPN